MAALIRASIRTCSRLQQQQRTLITGRRQMKESKPSAMTDPYPLPLQNNLQTTQDEPEARMPHPTDGLEGQPGYIDLDIKTMRSRLVYQTRKRGTLETGLLLSSFATKERLETMDKDELMQLDRLLTIPEWTLYYWSIGKAEPPSDSEWPDSRLLKDLRKHSLNKEKETRVMPELYQN